MDCISDCTAGGRPIRALTRGDDYVRECLAIEVDNGHKFRGRVGRSEERCLRL